MRIESVEFNNWLTHRHLVLSLTPMSIVVGPNGTGKSSVGDGITFALLNELRRVTAKGERKKLLSEGASKGSVKVCFAGGAVLERDILNGKITKPSMFTRAGACVSLLPLVLDPALLGRMTPDERRSVFQDVLNATPTHAQLAAELEKRGIEGAALKEFKGAHTGNLPDWIEMAKKGATEARGAWKSITGETYGSVKAASWFSSGPTQPTDEALSKARFNVAATAEASQAAEREVGERIAETRHRITTLERIASLRDAVKPVGSLADAIKVEDEAHDAMARARKDLETITAAALPDAACPHCGAFVAVSVRWPENGVKLSQSSNTTKKPTPAQVATAKERFADLERASLAATESRRTLEAKLERMQDQAAHLATLEAGVVAAELGVETQDQHPEDAAHAARKAAMEASQALAALERTKQDSEAAEERTDKAMRYHVLVEQWVKLAELIAADGILGEMLIKAMEPMAAYLRQIAIETGWAQVTIGADMGIMAGGRLYELLSESERWRVDTALAVVLAQLSDLRIVLLDRLDVLDIPSRKPAMGWLFKRVQSGALETCLLMGTMKEPPLAPKAVNVIWLGDRSAAAQKAA